MIRDLFKWCVPALILAIAIAAAGYSIGGRYSFTPIHDDRDYVGWRLDRLTGKLAVCMVVTSDEKGVPATCLPLPDVTDGVVDLAKPSTSESGEPWEEFGKPGTE